jgi:hypothetical protein
MDLNVHRRRLRGAVDDDEPSARERDLEQTRSRDRRVVLTMLSPILRPGSSYHDGVRNEKLKAVAYPSTRHIRRLVILS